MSALLDSLNASKGAYFKLKENLQCASAKLVTSKNFLEVSANKIGDCFQIDNISADGNTILNNKEKCDVFYDDRLVWIQGINDNVAKVGFVDNFEEQNVFIKDLYEKNL